MTPDEVVVAQELAMLRRVVRVAERFCRRKVWRRAVLLRSTRMAVVLRSVERAIGSGYVRREKGSDRRWSVFARGDGDTEVLVALVGGGDTRRLEEVRAPVKVEIVAPSLIDVEGLRRATGVEHLESPPETT